MTPDLSKGLDWWLTHSVTLALDVPKTGTIGSGELENRQRSVGISAFLLLSGPIRKRIQYLLVLNIRIGRTNRTPRISLLRNKTIRIRLAVNWNVYYPYRGSFNWEDPSTWETKRKVYLFYLVIQLNQWFVIVTDSNNHFIRHAYFLFSNGFTSFINGNFLM